MYACNSAILAVLAFSIPRSNNARLPMCLSLYMYLYLHLYLLAHNQTLDSTHACTYDDKHALTTPTRTCTGAAALAPLLGDANCRMTALDLRSINCGAQGAATATLSSALAANQTQH